MPMSIIYPNRHINSRPKPPPPERTLITISFLAPNRILKQTLTRFLPSIRRSLHARPLPVPLRSSSSHSTVISLLNPFTFQRG